MIKIIHTKNIKSRTFGWVQNPSNFRSLCNVVAVFDHNSQKHKELINKEIPALITTKNGRDDLINAMNQRPLKLSYFHLVGTGTSKRAEAPCNSIVQATVKGQGEKEYTDNWTSDGFVRWAHCLGFIEYDYADDTFSITSSGLNLSAVWSKENEVNADERKILVNAILSYPPAIRVLTLLAENNAHLTKFEIGRKLGFTSENGFTSMPQDVLIRTISGISDSKERNEMRNNWEGSSDKYARMISSWLIKLGLVEKMPKEITVAVGTMTYTEKIGQSFIITAQGITALRKAQGVSKHNRIAKNISFEMLSTKGTDRTFLRTRRSLIIKALSESRNFITADEIVIFLNNNGIETSNAAVIDDINGLVNIGLDISINENFFIWKDKINDFTIPISANVEASEHERTKDELRENISHISHEYLSLIDLAYDSKQNRLFEMKTMQLLTEECGFDGLHLGGSRKPDGIVYTSSLSNNYGVIIDTKSYSRGYNLPIGQADEMQRYIQENQRRDENPNKWWNNFGDTVDTFYFMFVAGHFVGRYKDQIDRISLITNTKGVAIEVNRLLLTAENLKSKRYDLVKVESDYFD